jgi:putative flippase GtrA
MQLRYVIASAASVAAGQSVLLICFGLAGWSAEVSNLFAFVGGGVVSYMLNRRWTWGRQGRSSVMGEVLPFWALALAGLLLSTWAVGLAEDNAHSLAAGRTAQTFLVMAASLLAFGVVWIVKFLVLDRFVFGAGASGDGEPSRERTTGE